VQSVSVPGREAGPVVLEIGVVEAEHDWHLHDIDQPGLTLTVRPHNRSDFDLRA